MYVRTVPPYSTEISISADCSWWAIFDTDPSFQFETEEWNSIALLGVCGHPPFRLTVEYQITGVPSVGTVVQYKYKFNRRCSAEPGHIPCCRCTVRCCQESPRFLKTNYNMGGFPFPYTVTVPVRVPRPTSLSRSSRQHRPRHCPEPRGSMFILPPALQLSKDEREALKMNQYFLSPSRILYLKRKRKKQVVIVCKIGFSRPRYCTVCMDLGSGVVCDFWTYGYFWTFPCICHKMCARDAGWGFVFPKKGSCIPIMRYISLQWGMQEANILNLALHCSFHHRFFDECRML